MKKYIIQGGNKLTGTVTVSGAKNVVSKAIVAACLTSEEVLIQNAPLISDLYVPLEIVREIGGTVTLTDHCIKIRVRNIQNTHTPLDAGAKARISSLFLAPLLARAYEAVVPNPGGCRLGARPIDRHIKGLEKMGAEITYHSEDGYFHAKTEGLHGTNYTFEKNTHTGTETLVLAAVLATGRTVLENAAEEPEIDDLIGLLNSMGAHIKRENGRTIVIDGVDRLHGTTYKIMPDRNEAVTFAILSALTGGNILVKNAPLNVMQAFLGKFKEAGGEWEMQDNTTRFYARNSLHAVNIITQPYPGFMTDWQGPWSVLMTQAHGASEIHETIYENRFAYVQELEKMGAKLKMLNPRVEEPKGFYNFNFDKRKSNSYRQLLQINGPTKLHNAVLNIQDLRAGITLVIASLVVRGESIIYGIEHLERGYESLDKRLSQLGANIKVIEENEKDFLE